jgi:hypothetical protein
LPSSKSIVKAQRFTNDKPQRISDWVNRPQVERTDLLEKRKKLWDTLGKYIHDNGGWVISIPHKKTLRIEVAAGSSLPSKLIEFGYTPTYCGVGTRITAGSVKRVDVLQIKLPER